MALGSTPASNRDEYQEYFLGSKGGRCVGLTTLPPSCADCLEISGLQLPGVLRACPSVCRNCFAYRIIVFDTAFKTGTVQYIVHFICCTPSVIIHVPETAIFIRIYMCDKSIFQCKQIWLNSAVINCFSFY